jgi:hypothetical protein
LGGSPHLAEAVERYRDRLAADMLVIFDGPPHNSGAPTLTFGARGIALLTLTTYGPIVAQHSGHWGNYVPNRAMRLAQLLASLTDDDGRVTIPGFYDGITIDAATRAILTAVPDDVAAGIAQPTSIHWHGMELESAYDGVAGWARTGSRIAALIAPGDSFIVQMTPPRMRRSWRSRRQRPSDGTGVRGGG